MRTQLCKLDIYRMNYGAPKLQKERTKVSVKLLSLLKHCSNYKIFLMPGKKVHVTHSAKTGGGNTGWSAQIWDSHLDAISKHVRIR